MHEIAQKLYQTLQHTKVLPLKYRELGRMIGDEHPQKVKHHLFRLQDEGYVTINEEDEEVRVVVNEVSQLTLYQIPIYGAATC